MSRASTCNIQTLTYMHDFSQPLRGAGFAYAASFLYCLPWMEEKPLLNLWKTLCNWSNHMKGLRLSRLSKAYITLWNLLQISLPQKLFLRRRKFSSANCTLTGINVRIVNNLHSIRRAGKMYKFLANSLRAPLTEFLFGRYSTWLLLTNLHPPACRKNAAASQNQNPLPNSQKPVGF